MEENSCLFKGLKVHITNNTESEKWEERVYSLPGGAWQQTYEYAHFALNWPGWKGFHILASCEDNIVGQATLVRYYANLKNSVPGFLGIFVPWLDRIYDRVTRIIMGPLIFQPDFESEALTIMLEAAYKLSKELRVYRLEVIPPIYSKEVVLGTKEATILFKNWDDYAKSNGFRIEERATYLLNVEAPLDALWKNLNSDARTKVRKAMKDGIVIRRCETYEDFLRYYAVLEHTEIRIGSRYHNLEFWKFYWEAINDFPEQGGIFVSVSPEGDVLSGQCIHLRNRVAVLSGVCYSELSRKERLYGNDLMQWHMIEWAHAKNARFIDWLGVSEESEKLKQVKRYKAKWGGTLVRYNIFVKGTPYEALHNIISLSAKLFNRKA